MSKILTIDFETYYDRDYSLTNLTTAEYINSPLFQIIGVSVSVNGGEPRWHTAKSSLDVAAFLSQFSFEEKGNLTVAHNAMFDGAILEWKLGIKPWRYFCTMMGARPFVTPHTGRMNLKTTATFLDVGDKGVEVHNAIGKRLDSFNESELLTYAAYCCNDVAITYKVFRKLFPHFPNSERRLIDLTIKKFTRPKLRLDKKVIHEALQSEIHNKSELLKATGLEDEGPLMSNPQFAKLLQNYGVDCPTKISPTTGQKTWAFAKSDYEFANLQNHPNPQVRALVQARLAFKSTIEETRLRRFAAIARCTKDSELAAPLLYYGAHPGRFSGLDKLNLQNLGRKSALRRAIIAPPNHKVVAGDLSQIEARITACLADQRDLLESFRYYDSLEESDRDVYCEFGDKVYSRTITKATEKERFVAKTGVLSLGYQSGANKFFESMRSFGIEDFTLTDAHSVVTTYRNNYTKIVDQWSTMEHIINCMMSGTGFEYGPIQVLLGQILLPNGMYLTYPNLTSYGSRRVYTFGGVKRDIYGGKLTENIVQALARIVMTTAEDRLAKAGVRAALSVHDELVYVIPEDKVNVFVPALRKALTAPVEWMPYLPINCEIGVGDNYGDAK